MIEYFEVNEFDKKYFIKIEDKIISYVVTHELYEVLDIIDIFTEEKYRNMGYAKQILKYIIDKTSAKKIMLEVNIENNVAIHLYDSLGFKVISERKNYYKNKTALIMEAQNGK